MSNELDVLITEIRREYLVSNHLRPGVALQNKLRRVLDALELARVQRDQAYNTIELDEPEQSEIIAGDNTHLIAVLKGNQ